jgi:hypothetical protein
MASLVIAALPVHTAATILLAATSKSPIKAATTDVREDDFLRLTIFNVAFFYIQSCSNGFQMGGIRTPNRICPIWPEALQMCGCCT